MPNLLPNDFLDDFPELEGLMETALVDELPDALFKTPYLFEEDLQELSLGKATLVPPNPISLFFVTACFVVVTLPACVAVAVFWWCWQRWVPLRVRH